VDNRFRTLNILSENVEEKIYLLSKEKAKLNCSIDKTDNLGRSIKDMEGKMDNFLSSCKVLGQTEKDLTKLNNAASSANERIHHINDQVKDVMRVETKIKNLNSSMLALDERMKKVCKEDKKIDDINKKMQSFTFMMEDIKVKMANMHQEEDRIENVLAKLSQVEFMLTEVGHRSAALKKEKNECLEVEKRLLALVEQTKEVLKEQSDNK